MHIAIFPLQKPGHSIENCPSLKNKVQDLVQARLMELETSNKQEKGGSPFSSPFKGKASVTTQATKTMDEMSMAAKRQA